MAEDIKPPDGASAEHQDVGSGGTAASAPPLDTSAPPSPPAAPTATPGAQPAAPTADEWVSLRDEAKKAGLDLSNHADDESAFRYLIQTVQGAAQLQARARELEQFAPYAQTYAQHGPAFQKWLAEQGVAPAAKQSPKHWNPPEFNHAWNQLITTDPATAEVKLRPGAPPEVLPKYLAYQQYRRDFGDRLLSDPVATL